MKYQPCKFITEEQNAALAKHFVNAPAHQTQVFGPGDFVRIRDVPEPFYKFPADCKVGKVVRVLSVPVIVNDRRRVLAESVVVALIAKKPEKLQMLESLVTTKPTSDEVVVEMIFDPDYLELAE